MLAGGEGDDGVGTDAVGRERVTLGKCGCLRRRRKIDEGRGPKYPLGRYPSVGREGSGRWCGYREVRRCKFGRFGLVYMDRAPSRSIFIHHLIRVRDPLDPKGALPARS